MTSKFSGKLTACLAASCIMLGFVAIAAMDADGDNAAEENVVLKEASPPVALGQDAVLVWKRRGSGLESTFVARIAQFSPYLFFEWEDGRSQGTVYISEKDMLEAKGYESSRLFVGGMDKKSHGATTLWLSRRIFRELKSKKKAKCLLDGVASRLSLLGQTEASVDWNGVTRLLPVIRVADDRGGERWFLDDPENPLLVRFAVRHSLHVLSAIGTDRTNTLRWIKGQKLENAPH